MLARKKAPQARCFLAHAEHFLPLNDVSTQREVCQFHGKPKFIGHSYRFNGPVPGWKEYFGPPRAKHSADEYVDRGLLKRRRPVRDASATGGRGGPEDSFQFFDAHLKIAFKCVSFADVYDGLNFVV